MMEQLEELQKEVEVLRKALEEATGTTVPPVIAGGAAGRPKQLRVHHKRETERYKD